MPSPVGLRADSAGSVDASVQELVGRAVLRIDIDGTHRRGALRGIDGATFAAAVDLAVDAHLPIVAVVSSSGADVHDGVAALHGWGLIARALSSASGRVPVLAVVTGPVVSGPSLLLGLADHVVMTRAGRAFVSGPRLVAEVTGALVDAETLGGLDTHARRTGVAALLADDLDDALQSVAELLGFLPDHADELPARWPTADPVDRGTPEAAALLPSEAAGSYDVRDVLGIVLDEQSLLELRAGWAPNLVTALATLGGRPVGVVANQPSAMAGTLDIAASQKGARFVSFCDAFNLPLVTVVDTPGFFPGKDLEWRGMIRHGAQLAFAYARATVPRISLTLRKSYGGAYIVMDSKRMGNDLAYAWPTAEIAVMGARGASEILHRGVDDVTRLAAEAAYEERHLNPYAAAERGLLDAVIDPAQTRAELHAALELLVSAREHRARRQHDNSPL
jgi:acetyl-CoA carboxylase carboxyltransferase component